MKPIINKEDIEYINDILVDLEDRDEINIHIQNGIFVEWSQSFIPYNLIAAEMRNSHSELIPKSLMGSYGSYDLNSIEVFKSMCISICPSYFYRVNNLSVKNLISTFYDKFDQFTDVRSKIEELIKKYGHKMIVESKHDRIALNIIGDTTTVTACIQSNHIGNSNESKIIKFIDYK